MAVAENLHLDVARADDELLDVERGIAEGRTGFALGHREGIGECRRIDHDPHAASAAAGRGLEHDGIPDGFGGLECGRRGQERILAARHDRHASVGEPLACAELAAGTR